MPRAANPTTAFAIVRQESRVAKTSPGDLEAVIGAGDRQGLTRNVCVAFGIVVLAVGESDDVK